MAHPQNPAVLAALRHSALAHLGLIVNHVGADDPLTRLYYPGLVWVQ
jgi:hypothetical protein